MHIWTQSYCIIMTRTLASLNIIDFNNNKEQILISNMANSSQFNSVFVNDNKILYKSYTENNESVWSLYENGNISTFTHDELLSNIVKFSTTVP